MVTLPRYRRATETADADATPALFSPEPLRSPSFCTVAAAATDRLREDAVRRIAAVQWNRRWSLHVAAGTSTGAESADTTANTDRAVGTGR